MKTENILKKIKEVSKNPKIPKGFELNQKYLCPLFAISGAINKTTALVEAGFEPTILDIFIPHIVMSFGPKLFANSLTRRFELQPNDIILYSIGLIFSIVAQHSPFLTYFTKEINLVAQYFGYTKLKNSPENTFKLFSWNITNDIAGMFLSKLIMKKKLRINGTDLFNMIFIYTGILYLRINKLNDYFIIVIANIIPLSMKAIEYLRSKKKSKSKDEGVIEKKTRRKASVASQLEKTK